MPAAASSRQPGTPIRFSGPAAQYLLAEERRWLASQLASRPARPWLWLAPEATGASDSPMPSCRGLRLHECADGFAGTVRCGLPLPLASECLGDVVLQHPSRERADALLEECARVLVEGGRLWMLRVNPWSPYRLRTRGDMPAPMAGAWVQRMRVLGLHAGAPRYLGPRWRMTRGEDGADGGVRESALPLRAAWAVVAEKRGLAPVAPAPVGWRHGTAPAA